jgi:RND family efflux transporter MFP subunit
MKQMLATTSLALALAGGLAACHGGAPRATAVVPPGPAHKVRTAVVTRSYAEALASAPGTVAARQRATLASRLAAAVVELPFREGERVAAGAVVVRLDDRALRSAESAADAALKAAEVDLARAETLLARNAATPREADEAVARAAAARAALSGVRDGLAYAVLRAPFAGTVAARPVHAGDVVSPGMPLVEIEGDGGLEVRATLDGRTAARVRTGARLAAEIDGQPEPLPVTVRSLSPAADPGTHRFEVRADLGAAPGLRSGLFARLLIPGVEGPARLTVPAAAVFERGGLTGVFVAAEDRARLRWVAMGEASEGRVELRAGVEAGERVVLEPAGLADGDRVEGAP